MRTDPRRLHAAARRGAADRCRHGRALPRPRASPRTGARDLLGDAPRSHRGSPSRRRAHAGADADRRQSRPDAAAGAADRADGAGLRRQYHHRVARAVGGTGERTAPPPISMPGGSADAFAAVVRGAPAAGRGARSCIARRASALGASLSAGLLAGGGRHRSGSRRRDRRRAAAADRRALAGGQIDAFCAGEPGEASRSAARRGASSPPMPTSGARARRRCSACARTGRGDRDRLARWSAPSIAPASGATSPGTDAALAELLAASRSYWRCRLASSLRELRTAA